MKTFSLKTALLFVIAAFLSQRTSAQQSMASPRDSVKGSIGKAQVAINYGSPSVKGRSIWGGLVPYNAVWRAGANEATTFTTDQTIQMGGKTLPAGRYALFMIPGEKEWTIIFNKTPDQWGAYKYDEKQDALRIIVQPKKSEPHERLTYKINPSGFSLFWDKLEIPVSKS